jgi:hypothetical protein
MRDEPPDSPHEPRLRAAGSTSQDASSSTAARRRRRHHAAARAFPYPSWARSRVRPGCDFGRFRPDPQGLSGRRGRWPPVRSIRPAGQADEKFFTGTDPAAAAAARAAAGHSRQAGARNHLGPAARLSPARHRTRSRTSRLPGFRARTKDKRSPAKPTASQPLTPGQAGFPSHDRAWAGAPPDAE